MVKRHVIFIKYIYPNGGEKLNVTLYGQPIPFKHVIDRYYERIIVECTAEQLQDIKVEVMK